MRCLKRWMSHRIDTPAQKEYIPVMKIKNHLLDDPKVDTSLQSPNVSSGTIKPTIIVLHYTASGGEDGKGDASYLSRASSRASAHVVAGRNGSLDQIVPFNKRAWHAGKSSYNGRDDVNDFSIGIEIDNHGWLDGRGIDLSEDQIHYETRNGKKTWEKYKAEQLEAVDEVIGAIVAKYNITDIVGHEDIAPGRKQDPGPALDEFTAKMKEKHLGKTKTAPKPSSKAKAPAQKGTKKVTANGLRLRARPNLHAAILTHLYEGYEVKVLQENVFPGWDKVQYKQKVGFTANRYLQS